MIKEESGLHVGIGPLLDGLVAVVLLFIIRPACVVQPAIEAHLVLPQHHVLTHHHGGLRQTDRQTDRQRHRERIQQTCYQTILSGSN